MKTEAGEGADGTKSRAAAANPASPKRIARICAQLETSRPRSWREAERANAGKRYRSFVDFPDSCAVIIIAGMYAVAAGCEGDLPLRHGITGAEVEPVRPALR